MKKLTAFLLFFCLISASTPAVTHALAHAVAASFEHSHDGAADSHLHHGDTHHNAELCLLPPALTRRAAAAPGADAPAALPLFSASSVGILLSVFTSPGDDVFVSCFRAEFIPQLASIPPPFHA